MRHIEDSREHLNRKHFCLSAERCGQHEIPWAYFDRFGLVLSDPPNSESPSRFLFGGYNSRLFYTQSHIASYCLRVLLLSLFLKICIFRYKYSLSQHLIRATIFWGDWPSLCCSSTTLCFWHYSETCFWDRLSSFPHSDKQDTICDSWLLAYFYIWCSFELGQRTFSIRFLSDCRRLMGASFYHSPYALQTGTSYSWLSVFPFQGSPKHADLMTAKAS